jgi:hypothetical protein
MERLNLQYGEYVVGALVSDCHGRLGQDDAIEVEEEDEFDDGRLNYCLYIYIITSILSQFSSCTSRSRMRTSVGHPGLPGVP